MLWVLLGLASLALLGAGGRSGLYAVLAGVYFAVVADLTFQWIQHSRLVFPGSALLTGLFVALIMSPTEPWYVMASCIVLALCAKHFLRTQRWTVFNPAAFGLLVAAVLFSSEESWWGALGGLPAPFLVVLVATGAYIVGKVNKWPLLLAFLATFYSLFTVASFLDSNPIIIEAFRPPYINAALFFGAFMLTDPTTAPALYVEQVVYGVLVAALSFTLQVTLHPQYFMVAGLLIGNACFALWRSRPSKPSVPLMARANRPAPSEVIARERLAAFQPYRPPVPERRIGSR